MAERKYAKYLVELVESSIISPEDLLSAMIEQIQDEKVYESIIRKKDWIDPEDNIFEDKYESQSSNKVEKVDQYKFMR